MSRPLVTVLTATVGNPLLTHCIESVYDQVGDFDIQHLIFIDGPEVMGSAMRRIDTSMTPYREGYRQDIVRLPYSVGKDRWNGHRMYGAGTYLAEGDFVIYLDDDNSIKPYHIQSCLEAIEGKGWTFAFRNIQDKDEKFICQDNCESLGIHPSVCGPDDYFIDVNCYFLRREVAVSLSPVWFRKFREPGQLEIDRAMAQFLRANYTFQPTYKYSVNYTVGNTVNSVRREFFINGNAYMMQKYNGSLPWVK